MIAKEPLHAISIDLMRLAQNDRHWPIPQRHAVNMDYSYVHMYIYIHTYICKCIYIYMWA